LLHLLLAKHLSRPAAAVAAVVWHGSAESAVCNDDKHQGNLQGATAAAGVVAEKQ
jgi:hypothetical protein